MIRARRFCAAYVTTWVAIVVFSTSAFAASRAETDAKTALKKAVAEFHANDFDGALVRLEKALERCGTTACSAATRGALVRDVGVMHLRKAERDAAANSFVEALHLDARLEINPAYDAPDLRAEWKSAKDEASLANKAQPGGDFIHSPADEQRVDTPLPVFIGYTGSAKIAKVILKYKSENARAYRYTPLTRRDGGWGGLIPCASVERGVMRYYVEAFDADGDPVASSGSADNPFFVPIRWRITASAPSLPGLPPPKTCGENVSTGDSEPRPEDHAKPAEPPPAAAAVGEACDEDSDCQSESCSHGECVARHGATTSAPPSGSYAHWWIGVASSIDLISLPAAVDVCKLTSAGVPQNTAGYYCTNPRDNTDYPTRASMGQNSALTTGNAGAANGGFAARDWRVLLSVDYAFSASFLLGARLGYVFDAYPGQAAVKDGHAFSSPIHAELRATYLFGDAPLADIGFAPYISAGGGVAEFDAQTTVFVRPNTFVGSLPLQAWITGGPLFVDVGAGARYAFSLRSAFLLGARGTLVFGGGAGVMPTIAPEVALEYGF